MDDRTFPDSLHVISISASPTDRVRLTDPYVEEVWSEFLGPTATLLARRLGRAIEDRPGGLMIEFADLAASVGVAPSVAAKALQRLHRFEVVHSDFDRGVIGVSGYAPTVGDVRVFRLSEAGRVAHERLTADLGIHPDTGGLASRMLAPVRSIAIEQRNASICFR